jgi:hypothetical protein
VSQIKNLRGKLGFEGDAIEFLGYEVDQETGRVYDRIGECPVENPEILYVLLNHYSKAREFGRTGVLVKFRGLPGGYTYEAALERRAVQPIINIFGNSPEMLVTAATLLNGAKRDFGDSSVEIPALPRIPIVYILWRGGELPTSASVLFDSSAGKYLPTEDLAVLAELTTTRLGSSSEHGN